MTMVSLSYLLYSSEAVEALLDAELQQLLATAHTLNTKAGVTGLLVVREGFFLQLLEGSKGAVLATFKRIERDPRHRHVKILGNGSIDARIFPKWDMGLVQSPGGGQDLRGQLVRADKAMQSPGDVRERVFAALRLFSAQDFSH